MKRVAREQAAELNHGWFPGRRAAAAAWCLTQVCRACIGAYGRLNLAGLQGLYEGARALHRCAGAGRESLLVRKEVNSSKSVAETTMKLKQD